MDYNYLEAITDDVRDYIRSEINLEEWRGNADGLEEYLNDTLWTDDSVTGNGSGSYTFNTYKAEEYLCHNLDLLAEAVEELGGDVDVLKDGAEACDVTIRCHLLDRAIVEALEEIRDDLEDGDDE